MTGLFREHEENQKGFTLIELLVVIIIIAILGAIAIPTFLGQRQHAQDAAAYTLVRNALTALQGAFVDTGDYTEITEADLEAIEPAIDWVDERCRPRLMTRPARRGLVTRSVPWPRATRWRSSAESPTVADLASVSASGNTFGIQVDTVSLNETGYVKVKVIDGEPRDRLVVRLFC